MIIVHPIEPIFNEKSKVLILGTFPSVLSREESFFYAHPQNRFWKVWIGYTKLDNFDKDMLKYT